MNRIETTTIEILPARWGQLPNCLQGGMLEKSLCPAQTAFFGHIAGRCRLRSKMARLLPEVWLAVLLAEQFLESRSILPERSIRSVGRVCRMVCFLSFRAAFRLGWIGISDCAPKIVFDASDRPGNKDKTGKERPQ